MDTYKSYINIDKKNTKKEITSFGIMKFDNYL